MDESPTAKALVILPFYDAERAEEFAAAVISRGEGSSMPLVLHGQMYEYLVQESDDDPGERGQVIEILPESRFEAFIGEKGENHHILRRIYQEESNESTA